MKCTCRRGCERCPAVVVATDSAADVLIALRGHWLYRHPRGPLPGDLHEPCGCVLHADGGGVQWPCEVHR